MPEKILLYIRYRQYIVQELLKSCTCAHKEEGKVVKFDKMLYFEMH